MRSGKFLAEESPRKLMEMHRLDTLEDVFLKLSKRQNLGLRRRSSILSNLTGVPPEDDMDDEMSGEFGDNVSVCSRRKSVVIADDDNVGGLPPEEEGSSKFTMLDPMHMKALIWKNFLWMWRNVGIMLFIIALPVAQIVLFCLAIGKNPVGLKIAIVNNELNSSMQPCIPSTRCDWSLLSCRYLQYLQKKTIKLLPYDNDEEAENAVKNGWAWGAIMFPSNYSDALMARIDYGKNAEDWDIEHAEMRVVMDMSNQQIGQLLQRDLLYAFQDFAKELTVACNYSEKVTSIPINFETPIYGSLEPIFTDFAAPGVILTIIFFLSVALTSGSMLLERNEGLLERTLVSGLTGTEILFGQVITQFIVVFGQTVMVLVVSFVIFKITCAGDIGWITTLTVLTGLCGMCFGFVIACFCDTERSATYLAMGSFLPIVMLCGIIWPVEGIHPFLKYISFLLPLTKSTESMRSMLNRGWSISEPTIYYGFIATLIWISIFMSISILLLKFKKG
ncbi:ABC transporter G family member 20 isoform X3 [Polyergus mexicanus]